MPSQEIPQGPYPGAWSLAGHQPGAVNAEMLLRASPASFVGRKPHRFRVAQLWDRSRVVVLIGPAGIGKSTLMRRIVEELGGGRPAHWYGCGSGDDLLGGIEGTLGLVPLTTSLDDRMFRIAAKLGATEAILCIDDVHRLGAEQAALWQLATHLRAGKIVTTSRTAVALGELETSAAVVPLGPLAPDEAATLIRDLLERLGRDGDAAALAFRAAGNPLWCRLLAGGAQRVERHLDSLLGSLTPAARATLERLSVFREAVPSNWAGADEVTLRDLEMRCLMERMEDDVLGVHDVVREIVVAKLSKAELSAVHRACADVYAGEAAGIEGELHHREAAGDYTGLARALHERAGAWLWVHRRVSQLERLTALVERAQVPLTPRLWLRRAMCASVQGRIADARAAFGRVGVVSTEDVMLAAAVEIDLMREDGAPFEKREARFGRALYKAHGPKAPPGGVSSADCGPLIDGYVRDAVLQCRVDRALVVYRTVRDSGLADPLYHARIANRVGYALCERGDPAGALEALRDAQACASKLGSPQLQVAIESLWTLVDARFGELSDAEAHLRRAVAMPLPAGEPSAQVGLEIVRAAVLARQGRLADARDGLEACCARDLAVMSEVRSALYSELAAVSAEIGDFARAQSAAREGRLSSKSHRFDVAYVGAHTALAQAELGMGRAARAHRRGCLAVGLAARSGLGHRRMVAELVVADAAIALGRVDEARERVTQAIDWARTCGARTLEATAHLVSATASLRRQAPEAAFEAAGEALRLCKRGGYPLLAARAHVLLGWSALLRQRDADASEQLAAAVSLEPASGSAIFEAELELLRTTLRARTGNTSARRTLEQRLARSTSRLAPLAWLELRRLAADPERAAVTRAGKQALARRSAAPEGHDLWVDASTGRARIDAAHEVDLTSRPVLLKLLCVVLAEPTKHFDKATLLTEVWQLPHRASREAMLQKAVQRLGRLLSSEHPHRFFAWDAEGRLELKAQRPCLVVPEPGASLNDRQRWLVTELTKRPTISSGEYRSALRIARVTAYRDLEELVELGLIRRRGKGRAVVYERSVSS